MLVNQSAGELVDAVNANFDKLMAEIVAMKVENAAIKVEHDAMKVENDAMKKENKKVVDWLIDNVGAAPEDLMEID